MKRPYKVNMMILAWKQNFLPRFAGTFRMLGLDEKSFFSNLLGLTLYLDYKPTNPIHADSPDFHTVDKKINFGTKDKIHLRNDVFDGHIVNGIRQTILYKCVLVKPPG